MIPGEMNVEIRTCKNCYKVDMRAIGPDAKPPMSVTKNMMTEPCDYHFDIPHSWSEVRVATLEVLRDA